MGRHSAARDREGVDTFESMREQMDRERDNFFRGVNPRDWPNEGTASRGGFFNRPRTSFAGFPSGQGMRAIFRQQTSWKASACCQDLRRAGSVSRVVAAGRADQRGPVVRHKYNTARNTTELPAKAS